jgi:hypothetical protein
MVKVGDANNRNASVSLESLSCDQPELTQPPLAAGDLGVFGMMAGGMASSSTAT